MKKISLISLTIALSLALAACSQSTNQDTATATKNSSTVTATNVAKTNKTTYQATSIPDDTYGTYSENDITYEYDESSSTTIKFSGDSADISGDGATLKDNVLTISSEGTYVLSGEFSGQVKVNADEQNVRIILNNATITSSDGPALYIEAAKIAYVTLAENSENTLTDSTTYTLAEGEDEPDATLFSKSDLTINGLGTLNVTGNYKNGIRGKDDVVITGGKINVSAKNDGIKGKDSVSILDGIINITTIDGDGIQANNSTDAEKGWIGIDGGEVHVTNGQDGIQAETTLSIKQVDLTIESTDPTADKNDEISQKGLKSTGAMTLDDGTFVINTVDDSLHSNNSITINNGTYTLNSQDDGIHADADLIINNGSVTVAQSYEGLEGKTIQIKDGNHVINSTDDGLNASDPESSSEEGGMPGGMGGSTDDSVYIEITGGVTIVSADGDGVDSNGNVNMSDGVVIVEGPTNGGNGALDYDGTWNQTGGTLLALGTQDMAMTPSDSSSQASLGIYLDSSSKETISIKQDDKILFSYTPSKEYSHIAVSSPSFEDDKDVTVITGATISGDDVNGYVSNATISDGDELGTYTLSGIVTNVSQDGSTATQSGMGGGGFGGNRTPN